MVSDPISYTNKLFLTLSGLVDISSGSPSLLPDYTALSTQMASANPTGVQMGSYTPTNTPQACPAVATGVWEAKASPLPPTPNQNLCSCMYNSLSCAVKGTVNPTNYGTLFGTVCGFGGGSACAGIGANPLTGVYGAYSMCNATEELSFAFNQYYLSQNSQASACNYQGAAGIKAAVSASGTCSALMNQAGAAGTGTVTSQPNASSSSGSSKKSAASTNSPVSAVAVLLMGFYVTLAGLCGAGMILL
jgi:1,3-beta-glucanosyltransferase GAS1